MIAAWWISAALAADPMLDALVEEMTRETTKLSFADAPPIYHARYHLVQLDQADAYASFGEMVDASRDPYRTLGIELRIGTPQFDNTGFGGWQNGFDQAIRHRCKRDSFAISALAALEKTVHRWQRLWERIDRLICPSQFVAERLIEFGIAPDRVVVLPNFIDGPTPALKPGQDWMYAGRLTAEKGLDVLLDAATQLTAHRLHIYGTGPLEEGLRRRAPPHVTFHGHVAPAQLATKLAQTAIVAVPSLWWENQPFAVTEAQAAGRVVVASHVGGIPELIDAGHDGILVPPGDADALAAAVRTLFADADLRQRLGRQAQERVRRHLNPDRHLQALLQHYRDLL